MDKESYNLLIAIGACHRLLQEHAQLIRKRASVVSVTHWCDVYDITDAYRHEEYMDAELSNGNAISWHLEITIMLNQFRVEADVRKVHDQGQDLLVEIADCTYLTVNDCAVGILRIARELTGTNPISD